MNSTAVCDCGCTPGKAHEASRKRVATELMMSESETDTVPENSEIAIKSPKKRKNDARFAEKLKMAHIAATATDPNKKEAIEKGITRAKRILNKLVPKESITTAEFFRKFDEILGSKSNQDAYQTSQRIIKLLQFAFPVDLDILGESFLKKTPSENRLRIDLPGLWEIFQKISDLNFADASRALEDRFVQIIAEICKTAPACRKRNSAKVSRAVVMAVESPAFQKLCLGTEAERKVADSLFALVASARPYSQSRLAALFAAHPKKRFLRLVNVVQTFVSLQCVSVVRTNFNFKTLNDGLAFLGLLQRANRAVRLIDPARFQSVALSQIFLYRFNVDNISEKCPTLLKHPWAVTVSTKQHLLSTENLKEQYLATHLSAQSALSGGRGPPPAAPGPPQRPPLRLISDGDRNVSAAGPPQNGGARRAEGFALITAPADAEDDAENLFWDGSGLSLNVMFCYFVVCRDHLAADSMRFLQSYTRVQLHRQLKIVFNKEDGVDEGGLKNEFFELLTKDVFGPKYGLFDANKESKFLWFSPNWTAESELDFQLCGTIIGLALYNNVLLDLNLPLAFFKHLLGQKPGLADLMEISPMLAKGLNALLDFEGDVENTFCRSFEASVEVMGEMKTFELMEKGSAVAVDNRNRQKFVKMYANWYLHTSVFRQIKAFKKGFDKICKTKAQWVLNLFEPEELKGILTGKQELNMSHWRMKATLKGYEWSDRTIRNLWQLLESFSLENKRKFLFFVTGCVRAPLKGLSELPLCIIKGDSSEMLPTARTCFNQIIIPPYETMKKLKQKVMLAIDHTQGFHLQ